MKSAVLFWISALTLSLSASEQAIKSPTVTLVSKDGKEFTMPASAAFNAGTLRVMLESSSSLERAEQKIEFKELYASALQDFVPLMMVLHAYSHLIGRKLYEEASKKTSVNNAVGMLEVADFLDYPDGIGLILFLLASQIGKDLEAFRALEHKLARSPLAGKARQFLARLVLSNLDLFGIESKTKPMHVADSAIILRTQMGFSVQDYLDWAPHTIAIGRKALDLSRLQLVTTEGLYNIADLHRIHSLKLSHNLLIRLTIADAFRKLKSLSLVANRLTEIDLSEGGLDSLEVFDVRCNELDRLAIPVSWTRLQILDACSNHLTQLIVPDTLMKLKNIQAYNNLLSQITLSQKLTALRVLSLSVNRLEEFFIPASWTMLENLDVGNNRIQEVAIPETLHNLRRLDLSANQISTITIPPALVNLTALLVAYNQLNELVIPPQVSKLQVLDVRNNNGLRQFLLPELLSQLEHLHLRLDQLDRDQVRDLLLRLSQKTPTYK